MTIKDEQAQEIKRSAESLYRLTKLLLTESRGEKTYITIPKGQNAIKYVQEVDRLENPQTYYHFQNGNYYAELRKGKKDYYVKTNYKTKEKELKESTLYVKKRNGIYNIVELHNDDFDYCVDNYKETVLEIIEHLRRIRDNEFLF